MTLTANAPARASGGSPASVRGAGVLLPSVASGAAVMLASVSLAPVFATGGWFGALLVTVVVVTGVGAVATWLRLPVFLVPVLQAVGLFAALVAQFTVDAPLGFVPTPESMSQLRQVLAVGTRDVSVYAPPVPISVGIVAITALGLGCVAIVVFVLEVSLRMPVPAGLALVAVYVVPSFVLDEGSPWWAFAFVAAAFMLLLATDERLGVVGWGRMLRRSEGAPTSPLSGLSSAALRLGVLAVVIAVALPILVPSLTDAVLGRNDTGVGGRGTGTGAAGSPDKIGIDPFVSVRRNLTQSPDTVLFTYSGDGNPGYLPMVVLTSYVGEVWRPSSFSSDNAVPIDTGIPPDPSLGPALAQRGSTVTTTITDVGLVMPYLPVPAHVTAVTIDGGDWFVDPATRTIFGDKGSTDGRTWTTSSIEVAPSPAELAAAPPDTTGDATDRLTRAQIPDSLTTLATSITRGETTDYGKAVALERWFRSNFRYSTSVVSDDSPQSPSYLDQFLTDKVGYCQQFAAAMALMAESLGIRARVVVGFTQGVRQGDGTWVVKGKDAHAWPELSFTGVGWVRFEPTPGGSNGTVTVPSYSVRPSIPGSGGTGTGANGSPGTGRGRGGKPLLVDGGGTPATGPTVTPGATTSADTWRLRGLLALLVVMLLVAAIPWAWRSVRRRRRLSAQAEVEDMWEELRDTARDLGIPWSLAQTPRQAVASVVERNHLRGEEAAAAVRIGRVTEGARYAAVPPSSQGMSDDVTTVRHALVRRAERSTRWRAALLPASLRRPPD